jgi:hypothetical protein
LSLADHVIDDGQELFGIHRLHDEPRGAQGERQILILFGGVRGRIEDERDAPRVLATLHLMAELKAIHFRHQDVGDN